MWRTEVVLLAPKRDDARKGTTTKLQITAQRHRRDICTHNQQQRQSQRKLRRPDRTAPGGHRQSCVFLHLRFAKNNTRNTWSKKRRFVIVSQSMAGRRLSIKQSYAILHVNYSVERTTHLIHRKKTGHLTRSSFWFPFNSNLVCKVLLPQSFLLVSDMSIKRWFGSLNWEETQIRFRNLHVSYPLTSFNSLQQL